MAMTDNRRTVFPVVYFEEEGRVNLPRVVGVIQRTMKRRTDLRTAVFFTAFGEGPALAYARLNRLEPQPQIVAVTFPPTFVVYRGGEPVRPIIAPRVRKFMDGVGIPVLTGRLPWDQIDGCGQHNEAVDLITRALSVFGGSMPLCIQAVLQACDMGRIEVGQRVIGATGDCAAVITASTTKSAFSKQAGLAVNEILCKPRNPTLLYEWAKRQKAERDQGTLELLSENRQEADGQEI